MLGLAWQQLEIPVRSDKKLEDRIEFPLCLTACGSGIGIQAIAFWLVHEIPREGCFSSDTSRMP